MHTSVEELHKEISQRSRQVQSTLNVTKNHYLYNEYLGAIFLHFLRVLSYPAHISINRVAYQFMSQNLAEFAMVLASKRGYSWEHSSLPSLTQPAHAVIDMK